MKQTILFFITLCIAFIHGYSGTFTITNSGTTFVPSELNIHAGDTVIFDLEDEHNAVEVSETVYDVNGTASNGGFNVAFGGGTVVLHNVGTYYYVCTVHAALGMKGKIIVSSATDIKSYIFSDNNIEAYPNPVEDHITIDYTLGTDAFLKIRLINAAGLEMEVLFEDKLAAGHYRKIYTFNRSLIPGLYFVSFTANNKEYLKKLIIRAR